jgi:hypothetical protein
MSESQDEALDSAAAAEAPHGAGTGPAAPAPTRPTRSALQTAGTVVHGIGWFLTKAWGLALLVGGIAMIASGGKVLLAGVAVAAYGVYLLLPGSKWVWY